MIPLAVRSHFSLMWGTTPLKKLCRAARERGYDRLALTDVDNLYGLWDFLRACQREGLTPIVGAEVTDPGSRRRTFCLVKNQTGYRNLCRLLTRRHTAPDFDLTGDLPEKAEGLLVLTANPDLLQAWREREVDLAAALPRRPNRVSEQARRTARRLGLPAAAVPANFFLDPADHEVHLLLRAIERNTSVSRLEKGDYAPPGAWPASADEYARRFEIWPEVVTATRELAEKIEFTGPDRRTVMPPWESPGAGAAETLRRKAFAGARRLYGDDLSETIVERLEHELALIERKGFSTYFLVVEDIIRRSPRICGRGSGAASLVAYCLRITNVCPVKHNLYFERFLNADRQDPPDIDVDFAWDERDQVIASVLAQYQGRAAMVCNHVLFQPRMAVRETAKVFGLMETEINQVARRMPWLWRDRESDQDLKARLEALPEMKDLDFPHPWPEILRLAQKIIGAPRYLSLHPGGVVITPGPLEDYVPLQAAPKGPPIIQWEKDGAEESGLVKIDLLGNRSLAVIRDAAAAVRDGGREFDETTWEPEDDPETQAAVARGLTMGCFYIESPAMRLLQQKTGVGDFEHLVVHSSIIRPAANEFIREYVRRLKGGDWDPIHPLLEDVLDETFGIMVYQEDVSRTAVALAGFSHADADGLRKVMSKKDKETALRDYRERFFKGSRAKGAAEETIEAVWEMMLSFSGYSFCKPHSASYARVSFQAAYLKVHFPAEFMAAVISNRGGFYSVFAYVSEARRMGLTVLPPDVTRSRADWSGRGRRLRAGLSSIKGLGSGTMAAIESERTGRAFSSLEDFLTRVRPAEDEVRVLVQAGALDCFGQGRAGLLWRAAGWKNRDKPKRPQGLFDGPDPTRAPPLPADDDLENLRRQFTVLGFLPDRHPIELFAAELKNKGLIKAADLQRHVGRRVALAGWPVAGKMVSTKHGDPMQFLTFEDETGLVETTFFPAVHRRFSRILDRGRPYILQGRVDEDFGVATLNVDRVQRAVRPGRSRP